MLIEPQLIKKYAGIATNLTKDGEKRKRCTVSWWGRQEQGASKALRRLCNPAILNSVILCDASNPGDGYRRQLHPIAFSLRKLDEHERELAVVEPCKEWKSYVHGCHVHILTNNIRSTYFKKDPKFVGRKSLMKTIPLYTRQEGLTTLGGEINLSDRALRRLIHQ